MHDMHVLTKEKYSCKSNYGNIRISFGGTIRTLPIYWPFTINLSYINGVSIPAEESQYIYSHLLNAWELVETIFTAT